MVDERGGHDWPGVVGWNEILRHVLDQEAFSLQVVVSMESWVVALNPRAETCDVGMCCDMKCEGKGLSCRRNRRRVWDVSNVFSISQSVKDGLMGFYNRDR